MDGRERDEECPDPEPDQGRERPDRHRRRRRWRAVGKATLWCLQVLAASASIAVSVLALW